MIIEKPAKSRQSKYCDAIKSTLFVRGHATNNELLHELRKTYPALSATTVHRATARLRDRGAIATAPVSKDGSVRYDINTKPHDHFLCTNCDLLRDTDVKNKITLILESSISGCRISGRLTIGGICKDCMKLSQKDFA